MNYFLINTAGPNSPSSTTPPMNISNLVSGGNIGTAVNTVDLNSTFILTQTTVGQTITLPTPSITTAARIITLENSTTSTTSILFYGQTVAIGQSQTVWWDGTLWSPITLPSTGIAADTIQIANATGATTITSWNSVVLIPTLTGNITLTYPTPVGNIGRNITLLRTGTPNTFTITHTPSVGVITSQSLFVELDTLNGALTLKAIDATNIRQVSNISQSGVISESIEATLASDITTNTANTAFDIVSLTLPSAGDWFITAEANTSGVSVNTSTFYLTDSANATILGTAKRGEYPTTNISFPITITKRINSAVAGQVVKLRAMSNVTNALTIRNNTTTPLSSTGGTKIYAHKVGGFIPITGQTVDYGLYGLNTTQSIAANANIPFDYTVSGNIPMSAGVVTLTANKTYKITAGARIISGGAALAGDFRIRNITAGINIGTLNLPLPMNWASDNSSGYQATAYITPSVTTQISVVNNSTAIQVQGFSSPNPITYLEVQQIGTSAFTFGNLTLSNVAPTDTSVSLNWTGIASDNYELLISINKNLYTSAGVLNTNIRRIELTGVNTYSFNAMTKGTTLECQIINQKTRESSNVLTITGTTAITTSTVINSTTSTYTSTAIPTGCRFIQLKLWGAGGGGGVYTSGANFYAGTGGYTGVTIDLAEARFLGYNFTTLLTVPGLGGGGAVGNATIANATTGAGGFPDGGGVVVGDTGPGGGGGSSRVYLVDATTGERILIAVAGAGGGNANYNVSFPGHGGGWNFYTPPNNDATRNISIDGYFAVNGNNAPYVQSVFTSSTLPINPGGRLLGGGLTTGNIGFYGSNNLYGLGPDSAGAGGGYFGGRFNFGDGMVGAGGTGYILDATYTFNKVGLICTSGPTVAPVAPNSGDANYAAGVALGGQGVNASVSTNTTGASGGIGRVVMIFT